MDAIEKLELARELFVPGFIQSITGVQLSDEHFVLKIDLKQQSILYIKYNDYQEYAYQVLISQQASKSFRYDNFDDRWEVSTRPHHLHSAGNIVEASPMNGDPHHDMPLLIKVLRKKLAD